MLLAIILSFLMWLTFKRGEKGNGKKGAGGDHIEIFIAVAKARFHTGFSLPLPRPPLFPSPSPFPLPSLFFACHAGYVLLALILFFISNVAYLNVK